MFRSVLAILLLTVASSTMADERLAFELPTFVHPASEDPASERPALELPPLGTPLRVAAGEFELTAVCFLGTECPMARAYAASLNELQADYGSRGLRIVGLFSNRQDSLDDLRRFVDELQVDFAVARDTGNGVADQYAATRTPEVFLLDKDLQLRYHGRIDDQYAPGVTRQAPNREDLRVAIEELLAGQAVSVSETIALGCIIGRVKEPVTQRPEDNSVTYTEHISRVLQRNCVECHRAGEIGPFAMDSYDEVLGWAETMLETIDNGRMPPWHADSKFGQFANAREMSHEDQQLFRDWIAGGLVEGDAALMPPPLEFTAGWQLPREPDLIVDMRGRPFVVPKAGVVEYQYFVADLDFQEDKWVSAAQVVPGSRGVVHHAIAFVRPPDGSAFRGVGWLSAYVPGQRIRPLPTGHARKIPAGSKLVFQMHYTPNGSQQEDITKLGLLFCDASQVTHEVYTLMGIDQEFEIPPQAADYQVHASLPQLPAGGELLAVTPHMHFRGKSFRLFAESDAREVLLNVPNYDFNWQHTYEFESPLPLDPLQRLSFDAAFDNSAANPFNPDPTQWVTWGDQTWEEMAVAFFEVAEPLSPPRAGAQTLDQSSTAAAATAKAGEAASELQIEQYISKVLSQLDKNGDGLIKRSETGIVLRRWNFTYWDSDGDDVVTTDELRKVAESLYR